MYESDISLAKKAFDNQAIRFDEIHANNPIVSYFRKILYEEIVNTIPRSSRLLDLGGGTGVDAINLAKMGYKVHVIDISENMINQLSSKVKRLNLEKLITYEIMSYTDLDIVKSKFDLIYSNFGALNCIPSLKPIITNIPKVLKTSGYLMIIYMSAISPWEILHFIKNPKFAMRRIKGKLAGGITSNVDGIEMKTYYFSSRSDNFSNRYGLKQIKQKSLGLFVPPPFMDYFIRRYPKISNFLLSLERQISHIYPFNLFGDLIFRVYQHKEEIKEN